MNSTWVQINFNEIPLEISTTNNVKLTKTTVSEHCLHFPCNQYLIENLFPRNFTEIRK